MSEKSLKWNTGSFRDPGSRVYQTDDTIYRTLKLEAAHAFQEVRGTGVLESFIKEGWIVPTEVVDPGVLGEVGQQASLVLQHAKIPFISYPYEWSFAQLRAAALLHLKLHLRLLDRGFTLSDASAYNVQFVGAKPVFIDVTSLRPYHEGEYWQGHRQFCEQFLNPLLLHAVLGISHNAWFRGNLEGVPLDQFAALAPWRACLNWRFFLHVVLHNRLQRRAEVNRDSTGINRDPNGGERVRRRGFSRQALVRMLLQLDHYISKLAPRQNGRSTWGCYADHNTYEEKDAASKRAFVGRFIDRLRPRLVFDVGCNSGDYAAVALQNGATYAVGFDADQQALNAAFHRAHAESLPFLPLYQNFANPSPDQGWNQLERQGLNGRAEADALLALALIHHLAIARNIPLDQVVGIFLGLSSRGVLEFVPKTDPTVQTMLALREDIFPDYTQEHFEKLLTQRAHIVERETISATGRTLYMYEAG